MTKVCSCVINGADRQTKRQTDGQTDHAISDDKAWCITMTWKESQRMSGVDDQGLFLCH